MPLALSHIARTLSTDIEAGITRHPQWNKHPLNVVQELKTEVVGTIVVEGRGVKSISDIPTAEQFRYALAVLEVNETPEVKIPVGADNVYWGMRRK